MIAINERITVFGPGEQLPAMTQDAIKIYLAGSVDFANTETDWQGMFIQGLAKLTDPIKGLLLLKNVNFIIFNPKMPPTNPIGASLDNPEFVQAMQWRMSCMDMADVVILNFLKKSVSPVPVLEFGSLIGSGKLVVRCSEEYQIYPQVRIYCEKYQVPLLTGKTSVKDIILAAGSYISKFRDLQQYQLPE